MTRQKKQTSDNTNFSVAYPGKSGSVHRLLAFGEVGCNVCLEMRLLLWFHVKTWCGGDIYLKEEHDIILSTSFLDL